MILRPCGITSQMAIYRYKRSALVDFIIERPLFPSDWARACRDWLVQSHNRTATRLPTRPVVDSLCCGKATPVETCHRHVSKSRLSNPPPAFRQSKKDIPFGMSFRFGGRWWIRTTEVIDDRFTVCSLWPLGKPSIFNYQLDWSWWTDLNPRPADYKSAALPTELHQRFVKPSVSATYI